MSALTERAEAARRVACRRCQGIVLEAPLRESGLTVMLGLAEVLPRMRCPTCLSERLRDSSVVCWRCGDTRWVGEQISGFGAAIGEDGLARPVDLARVYVTLHPSGMVRVTDVSCEGEAFHRAHRCP